MMSLKMDQLKALRKERGILMRRLLRYREMLPGSFVERRLTCGKPNCACVTRGQLHTAAQLTYRMAGKTTTKMIPTEYSDSVRKRVQMHREFQRIVERIVAINMQLMLELMEKK
jgi:hypothetical protein